MGESRRPPHFARIDSRNKHLPVSEFEQPLEIRFHITECQSLGNKHNRSPAVLERASERIIIANGTLPFVQHATLLEGATANRGPSAPAKIPGFFTQHGNNRRVPRGKKQRRQILNIRDQPSHRGGCSNSRIRQWSDKIVQPVFSRTAVGIGKHQHFKFFGKLLNGRSQIATFSPQLMGWPAITRLALTRELFATLSMMLLAGSFSEARIKKIS